MARFCLCEERSDVAVYGWAPCCLGGGLLRCARNDGVAFAMTAHFSASFTILSLRGAQRRGSLLILVSARSVATWQSMVEHRAVCEVDCFAALAMTEWSSQ